MRADRSPLQRRTLIVALLSAAVLTTPREGAAADAPRVVRTAPVNGAAKVPPGDQTLTFVFSERMATGRMSVTGGDLGAFPEIVGPPRFSEDGRTFSVPIRLKPSTTYVVGANGPNHRNFTSAAGVPATPFLLKFSTGDR